MGYATVLLKKNSSADITKSIYVQLLGGNARDAAPRVTIDHYDQNQMFGILHDFCFACVQDLVCSNDVQNQADGINMKSRKMMLPNEKLNMKFHDGYMQSAVLVIPVLNNTIEGKKGEKHLLLIA